MMVNSEPARGQGIAEGHRFASDTEDDSETAKRSHDEEG